MNLADIQPGKLLRVPSVARLLDCSKKRVYQMLHGHLLHGLRLSQRNIRVTSDSLIELLKTRAIAREDAAPIEAGSAVHVGTTILCTRRPAKPSPARQPNRQKPSPDKYERSPGRLRSPRAALITSFAKK